MASLFGKAINAIRGKKAISPAEYADATIEARERYRSAYMIDNQARQIEPLFRGYPFNCADVVARSGSQVPLRMYRTRNFTVQRGTKTYRRRGLSPIAEGRRSALASGSMGRKAATYSGMGRDVYEVTSSPMLDLLAKPNEMQNGEAMDYQLLMMLQFFGEMFYSVVDTGRRLELAPMLPQHTQVIAAPRNSGQIVGGYYYGRSAVDKIEMEPGDVLHVRYGPNPHDVLRGWGPMHACFQAARIVAENEDFDYEMIDRGNIPPLFISLNPEAYNGQNAVEDFEKHVTRRMRGARGKTRFIVGAGLDLKVPSGTAKEMQTLERIREHKATIRNAFKVSASVLEMNDANLASAREGGDQFWALAVRPLLNLIGDFWSEALPPLFGETPGDVFFAYDDPTINDPLQAAQVAEIDLRTGVRSINEVRQERGDDAIGPDGDVYRINGVPVDQAGQPDPQPSSISGVFALAAPEAPETKATTEAGSGCATEPAPSPSQAEDAAPWTFAGVNADAHRGDLYADCEPCGCETVTKADSEDLAVPDEFISAAQARNETEAIVDAVNALSGDLEEVIRDAKERALAQAASGVPIDLTALQDAIVSTVGVRLRALFDAGFNLAEDDIAEKLGPDGTPEDFVIPNPEAVDAAFQSLAREFVTDITDGIASNIERAVQAGIEAGDSIAEIQTRLLGDTDLERYQAERIARTETSRAMNSGKRQRYKAVGVERVFWVNAPGATSVHRAIAAQYPDGQDIDEPFIRAGTTITGSDGSSETFNRDVYFPPARPNCRCSLQTRRNEIEEAAAPGVFEGGDQ